MRAMHDTFTVEHDSPDQVTGRCTYCGEWGTRFLDGCDNTVHTAMCDALHVVELRLAKLGDK